MSPGDWFDRIVRAVDDLSAPSTVKFDPTNSEFAKRLGVDARKIWTGLVSKPGNLNVRFNQPGVLSRKPVLGIALLKEHSDLKACVKPAEKLVREGKLPAIAIATNNGSWGVRMVLDGSEDSSVATQLQRLFPAIDVRIVQPMPPATAMRSPAGALTTIPLIVDERVRRMVRLAIASAPAVMLVGPPGTGKTTLLRETVSEIAEDPARFGFTRSPELRWVTPEESWTTRELVGGETVDEHGVLRFRPGHVLDAIRSDEWLVLDEANRADLDKIFGGLLTWLAGQEVELGKASTALNAPVVTLGWADTAGREIDGLDRLSDGAPGEAVRFKAGREWRLLGTYNAVDAQRVFRFGQALGRRFVRVPIPPLEPVQFRTALEGQESSVPKHVQNAIAAMYSAHFADSVTQLGPALFFWMQDYVRVGLVVAGPDESVHPSTGALLCEAYLAAAGTWLAKLEDVEINALRERIPEEVLPQAEWSWLLKMLPLLG